MDARQIYLKGNEAFAACNYEQALSSFLSILDTNAYDENLLLKISQCYQEMARYDDAIEFLERLLNLTIERGNFKKAIAICKRILSIDPDDTEVVLKLANIFRRLKQYGEASYYYKVVAQHYEYAGFMDKAIEILQIIKDLGQEGIEDLLEIVKKEYKRGAKSKVDQSIDSIITELKNGEEHNLLDVALNLALTNSPDNINYVIELATLYFRNGKLISCLQLCLWGLHLSPRSSVIFILLTKSLWALGYDELAKRFAAAVANGDMELDDLNARAKVKKIFELITSFEREKVRIEDQKIEKSAKEELEEELAYLEKQDFTKVDHGAIEHDIVVKEFEDRLQDSSDQKTMVIDAKKKSKLPPKILEKMRGAEILISEGLYDKASKKLFALLEEEPGQPEVKELLEKALKLSNNMDSIRAVSSIQSSGSTTDEMIEELERYLEGGSFESTVDRDREEQREAKSIVEIFNSKIRDVLMPEDYKTLFDLGIAYMELELWQEGSVVFKRVMDYLSVHNDDPDKLLESKIYYAYTTARVGTSKEIDDSISFLNNVLNESVSERSKLDVLYYLAQCYEIKGDVENARNSYKGIVNMDSSYRDVDIRLAVIGK